MGNYITHFYKKIMIDKITIELTDEGAFIIRGGVTICLYDRITALKEINAQMTDLAFIKQKPNDLNTYTRKEYEDLQTKLQKEKKANRNKNLNKPYDQ